MADITRPSKVLFRNDQNTLSQAPSSQKFLFTAETADVVEDLTCNH